MDYKNLNAPSSTITRDMMQLSQGIGNIYETVKVIGRRSNQISSEIKHDLEKKLQEFVSYNETLEEIFENREQIEISRFYEKLPKPTLLATQELIEDKIYYKNPTKDKDVL
jgi:DNA-directed RNA polymerase subunit K/omega